MKTKRVALVALCAALALFGAQAFAEITIDITAPQITFTGNTLPVVGSIDNELNQLFTYAASSQFETEVDKYETEAESELDKYGTQDSFAQGFADANAMSSRAGTLQGFEGYKTFGVMLGYMIGIQLPSSDPNALSDMSTQIADDPDIYLGIANAMNVNVGFNMSKVLGLFSNDLGEKTKRFYLNVHGGFINQSSDLADTTVDMRTTTFGIGVNYQLVQPKGVVGGLFKWRGVSLGSGFTYQRSSFDLSNELDPITNPFSMTTPVGTAPFTQNVTVNGTFIATPRIDLGVDMRTFSIPLEAVTSVQVLWVFNVTAGIGADLVFGKSDITATASSELDVQNVSATVGGVTQNLNYDVTQPGAVVVDASTVDISPTFARARVMTGIGANMGPIKLDVPFYYYFSDGYSVGMSVGFVW